MTKNYNVEELEKMRVEGLKVICKENGLPCYKGKKKLTKAEMIANISKLIDENAENNAKNLVGDVTETEDGIVPQNAVVENTENATVEKEIDIEGFFHTKNKDNYIESAEVGTLIAFVDEHGKPRTAALVNRSSKRRVLKVVTEFNWEFVVPYEKVLWVRKGKRWPNGVFSLLKGYKNGRQNINNQ